VTQWAQYHIKFECGLSLDAAMHIHVRLHIML
jgi:hypothetical protein